MIIHCSAKLSEKLPEKPLKQAAMPAIGKLQHWHAHFLTIQRRQCVLFCEDETRFMLLAKGLNKHHLNSLTDTFETTFHHGLVACCGADPQTAEKVISLCGHYQLDTTTNRSVQGSMRVAASDMKFFFAQQEVMEASSGEIQAWLNNRPLTVKGRKGALWPDQAMTELMASLV